MLLERFVQRLKLIRRAHYLLSETMRSNPSFMINKDLDHGRKKNILFFGLKDPLFLCFYFICFGFLNKSFSANIHLILSQSVSNAIGVGLTRYFLRTSFGALPFDMIWMFLYRKYINGRVGRLNKFQFFRFADLKSSREIWEKNRECNSFEKLKINGILVGDLIIDSYLRFRPKPYFEPSDPFVLYLIFKVISMLRALENEFDKISPDAIFTTYTTYIEHGVPVRFALMRNIPVYALANRHQVGAEITKEYPFHSVNGEGYLRTFENCRDRLKALNAAQTLLNDRFSGKIDSAISYMERSAYSEKDTVSINVDGHFCLFLHDFYDSPHCYHDFVFRDYWDWTIQTLDFCIENHVPVCVKPHPNNVSLAKLDIKVLQERYPSLTFVDATVSVRQLADAGITCGISAGGTVAGELAYFGIPTIGCVRSSHHEFNFSLNSLSKSQYFGHILQFSHKRFDAHCLRRHALAYNYVRNCHGCEDLLSFRSLISLYFNCFRDSDHMGAVRLSGEVLSHPKFHHLLSAPFLGDMRQSEF